MLGNLDTRIPGYVMGFTDMGRESSERRVKVSDSVLSGPTNGSVPGSLAAYQNCTRVQYLLYRTFDVHNVTVIKRHTSRKMLTKVIHVVYRDNHSVHPTSGIMMQGMMHPTLTSLLPELST